MPVVSPMALAPQLQTSPTEAVVTPSFITGSCRGCRVLVDFDVLTLVVFIHHPDLSSLEGEQLSRWYLAGLLLRLW